jgi:hypothetical protein
MASLSQVDPGQTVSAETEPAVQTPAAVAAAAPKMTINTAALVSAMFNMKGARGGLRKSN